MSERQQKVWVSRSCLHTAKCWLVLELRCAFVYLMVEVAECRFVFCKLLHKRLRKIPDPQLIPTRVTKMEELSVLMSSFSIIMEHMRSTVWWRYGDNVEKEIAEGTWGLTRERNETRRKLLNQSWWRILFYSHNHFLSPPLLSWSRLFVFLPHVGNAHFGVKPVNLVSELAITQTQPKTWCKAHFVDVQNLLDDSLE